MQDDMKQEEIEITYSYWDGSGHRKVVTVRSFVFFLVLRECDCCLLYTSPSPRDS